MLTHLSFIAWIDVISLFLSVKCLSTSDIGISELDSAGNISSEKAIGCTESFHKPIVSSSHVTESSFHDIFLKEIAKSSFTQGPHYQCNHFLRESSNSVKTSALFQHKFLILRHTTVCVTENINGFRKTFGFLLVWIDA